MSAHAVHGEPRQTRQVDPAAAEEFLALYHAENPAAGPVRQRVGEVNAQIERYGTYVHTAAELTFGARVAWRNSSRCIGRLYWRSLRVRDRRHVTAADQVAAEAFLHLREATNSGRVRPTLTVFAADLQLRWHAVPAISNLCLEIGGIFYPAALPGGAVQRLVHGHRDRRPQPGRRLPL